MFTKNMKAGYQGRRDAMREKAEKLMNHPGHADAVYFSKSAADREHMRPYKEGGHIKERKAIQKNIEHFKDEMERHKQHEHHKKMEHLEKTGAMDMKKEKMFKDKMKMKEGGCMKKMKDGGSMKEMKKKDCMQKFAMGGVAKIRLEEATKDGMPKKPKKSNVKSIM